MKPTPLSKRLETVLKYVDCRVLADIGTDHGYTPAAACELGLARFAIACDISRDSLKKADAYFREGDLSDRIETRLGYGFDPIAPGEADMAVISGMGGMLIREIIQKGLNTVKSLTRIILGPQRDLPALRQSLNEMGIIIKDEELVLDGRQFYNILICEPGATEHLTPEGLMFGQALINKADPVLKLFLMKLLEKNTRILEHAENKTLKEEIRLTKIIFKRKGWDM
ncbi:MAG: class I SAM-dependent methyltransferase [Clostridiales bacterium]|jgi:tRNA (adenine22-N1)-methyltransferase|nr:class I SAM-dependent methyltransferase [Clostridiales bacterium]